MKKIMDALKGFNFVYFMAFYLITAIMLYFFKLTFTPTVDVNNQQASEIKTSLIGALGAIVGYLFGVVHGNKKKEAEVPVDVKQDDGNTPIQ